MPDDASARLYALGRLVDWPERHSPIVSYPWAQTERILHATDGDGSSFDGPIFQYTNPVDDGPPLPTIGCAVELLTPGLRTAAHRHTASAVYHGSIRSTVR